MIKNNQKIKLSEIGDFLAKFTENSDHVYWISSPDFKKNQYISPSYAKSLGSEIKLISQEGVGTTFYFDIISSMSSPEGKQTAIQETFQQKTNTSFSDSTAIANLFCLLVEDNAIALKVLESTLADAGIKYESSIDGESALIKSKTQCYDFILTDIGLPNMSGYEFVEQYRQWEKAQNKAPIPIFALTAHVQDNAQKESLKAGINAIFIKPFSIQTLNTILTYLQTHHIKQNSPKSPSKGLFESELPDTEAMLFTLNSFSILDIKKALSFVGNDVNTLKDILSSMVNDEIPNEKKRLDIAYLAKDWNTIEDLAHKMKGGAIYVGAERLKVACQYVERYRKTGRTEWLEKLYQQMMVVIDETRQAIHQYLKAK